MEDNKLFLQYVLGVGLVVTILQILSIWSLEFNLFITLLIYILGFILIMSQTSDMFNEIWIYSILAGIIFVIPSKLIVNSEGYNLSEFSIQFLSVPIYIIGFWSYIFFITIFTLKYLLEQFSHETSILISGTVYTVTFVITWFLGLDYYLFNGTTLDIFIFYLILAFFLGSTLYWGFEYSSSEPILTKIGIILIISLSFTGLYFYLFSFVFFFNFY